MTLEEFLLFLFESLIIELFELINALLFPFKKQAYTFSCYHRLFWLTQHLNDGLTLQASHLKQVTRNLSKMA